MCHPNLITVTDNRKIEFYCFVTNNISFVNVFEFYRKWGSWSERKPLQENKVSKNTVLNIWENGVNSKTKTKRQEERESLEDIYRMLSRFLFV